MEADGARLPTGRLLATQAGHTSWAFVAVEKQLLAAQQPPTRCWRMGVSTLSWVLLRQGRWEEAQRVAERKADALEPGFRKGTKDQFAVYGNLLLAAATPAARRGQHTEAAAMLKAAEAAAVQSGPPGGTEPPSACPTSGRSA